MRRITWSVLAFSFWILSEGSTFAQKPPAPEQSIGLAMRLKFRGIQQELKLDESQIRKAQAVVADIEAKLEAQKPEIMALQPDRTQGPPSNEALLAFRKKNAELVQPIAEEANKALAGFLKSEQIKRLKQIDLQSRGFGFLTVPDQKAKLLLTPDQEAKIRKLQAEFTLATRQAMLEGGADRNAAMKKAMGTRYTALAKIVDILDEDQKKVWKDLWGEPYDFTTIEGKPEP